MKETIDELRAFVSASDQPLFEFSKKRGRPKLKKQMRQCKACAKWFERKPTQNRNIKSCSEECAKKLRFKNIDWATNGYRMRQKKRGRPTVMTEETIKMLEQVFALGGTDQEACLYADISVPVLIAYQQKNPEFLERKRRLKVKPVLTARIEVVKGLAGDKEFAFKFLERRKRDEFGTQSNSTSVNVAVADQINNNTLRVDPMFQKIDGDQAVNMLKQLRGEQITTTKVKQAEDIVDLDEIDIDDDFVDSEDGGETDGN
jgi:hypothetical protein